MYISIEEFKRILLNVNNQPFFLEFNLDNKNKLQDLIDKSEGPVKIFYNFHEYNLEITNYFDQQNKI